MATEFKLPELGENIESGDVVRIAVTAGESIKEGQAVVELETDKAVVEVPSTVNGVIDQVIVTPSQKVKVGDVLFTYSAAETSAETDGKKPAAVSKESSAEPPEVAEPAVSERPTVEAKTVARNVPELRASAVNASSAEFRLPELGENIESGEVVRVGVEPGGTVSNGQTVLELETDKAVVEVPSTVSGTVSEVKAQVGQKLKVGDLIFTVAATAGAPKETAPAAAPATPRKAAPGVEENPSDQNSMSMARHSFRSARTLEGKSEEEAFPPDAPPQVDHEPHPAGLEKHAGHEHRTVPAAPIVRKLAREIGIDIYLVKGSGPGGRISESDVKAFAKGVFARMADPAAAVQVAPGAGNVVVKLPDFSRFGKIEKVSLRGIRRKTAEHLAVAWNVIPHVTQFDKADVTELEELRKRFAPKAEKLGGKMTMTAIALKIVASGLKAFPQFNASIDMASEEIIYKRYINVGVAVDTDRGLLVPVIRDVDKKNIIELAVELSTISKKARDKKLTAEDMEGGSFTITNLGGVGGTSFTPIVNHPEVAILGMSRSRVEPVWMNDKFEPRTMLPLSVSYDHRIIDGADAARFTRWIVDALEQPFLLSVQG
ncbi:MAG TPA: 2-oxo acid dehydrogenase subunit E2 [Candidatus Saccharimonadales bacterium]|nr:2-oxo acid dehydrogenase subunit E2 [Candidatus Saccharimonadales bacterium]